MTVRETQLTEQPPTLVLRIFFKILAMRANFCEILQNLVHIDFKILEKVLSRLCAHIGTNFGKFWLSNFVKTAKLW